MKLEFPLVEAAMASDVFHDWLMRAQEHEEHKTQPWWHKHPLSLLKQSNWHT
jgi:hypothetical protein